MRRKLAKAGEKVRKELQSIVRYRRKVDATRVGDEDEDILEALGNMPLEVLSRYVHAESESLRNAKSNLDGTRMKGVHRAYAKTERFVVEFDRFLTAYSGIVNIVAFADVQYGGIATGTLSLLFSVRS